MCKIYRLNATRKRKNVKSLSSIVKDPVRISLKKGCETLTTIGKPCYCLIRFPLSHLTLIYLREREREEELGIPYLEKL